MRKFNPKSMVLALALLVASPALAHTGGFTYEATVSNYFVDVGSNKLTFAPGELALFEYNLYPNMDPNNLADFDSVYVTVGDDSGVYLSTYVHRPEGMLTVMSYSFPKAGTYQMSARFQKGTDSLAEVSFPVEVGEGTASSARTVKIMVISVIALAAMAGTYAYMTRTKPDATVNS